MGSSKVQLVAEFAGQMPTGVSVGGDGRKFVCFPRWSRDVKFTVGELLTDGSVVPYPNLEINRANLCDAAHHFISVQSVQVTDESTLWVLDSGRPLFMPAVPGAAKLVQIDLRTAELKRIYEMPYAIARPLSYFNDVRFDFRDDRRLAYITDSATQSAAAIVVVDLATGEKRRCLDAHPSVQPDATAVPVIEQQPLRVRLPCAISLPFRFGADGIALSPDGTTLYYSPLSSRRLYSVRTAMLGKPGTAVQDLGLKGFSDGLECDAQGRVYAGDLEQRQIRRRELNGRWHTIAADSRLLWTDTLSIASDGYLYFTVNQLHRMGIYNGLRDRRKPPYYLFRTAI